MRQAGHAGIVFVGLLAIWCGGAAAQGTGKKGCYFGECPDGPYESPTPRRDYPQGYPERPPYTEDYRRGPAANIVGQCHAGPQNIHLDITSDYQVYLGPGMKQRVATAVETGLPLCPVQIFDPASGISFCIVGGVLFAPTGPVGDCWVCPSPQCH